MAIGLLLNTCVFIPEKIHCPVLPAVNGSTPNSNDTTIHTVVNYTCNAGRQFSDSAFSKIITCGNNGEWNPTIAPDYCRGAYFNTMYVCLHVCVWMYVCMHACMIDLYVFMYILCMYIY